MKKSRLIVAGVAAALLTGVPVVTAHAESLSDAGAGAGAAAEAAAGATKSKHCGRSAAWTRITSATVFGVKFAEYVGVIDGKAGLCHRADEVNPSSKVSLKGTYYLDGKKKTNKSAKSSLTWLQKIPAGKCGRINTRIVRVGKPDDTVLGIKVCSK